MYICQLKKDTQGCIKLTGTSDCRNIIMQTSELLQDGLLISLSDCEMLKINYLVKTFYAKYRPSGERRAQMQIFRKREATTECPLASPSSSQKRAKTGANSSPEEKPFIIWDQIKCQGGIKKFRVCEESAADALLKAASFNEDSVYTWFI